MPPPGLFSSTCRPATADNSGHDRGCQSDRSTDTVTSCRSNESSIKFYPVDTAHEVTLRGRRECSSKPKEGVSSKRGNGVPIRLPPCSPEWGVWNVSTGLFFTSDPVPTPNGFLCDVQLPSRSVTRTALPALRRGFKSRVPMRFTVVLGPTPSGIPAGLPG